jgi:lauroyl/myristoyl acyltransferase
VGRLGRTLVALGNLYRRGLAALLSVLGPRIAYWLLGAGGAAIYRLLEPVRRRSEGQLRAALGATLDEPAVQRIARQSFVHRMLNLADLMLVRRWLPATLDRNGARIPPDQLQLLLEAQQARRPLLLVTAYYGPYDIWPVVLALNGVKAAVIYRRHANAGFDEFRRQVRSIGGSELIPLEEAATHGLRVLENGGTLALLADHHVQARSSMQAEFLGQPTSVQPAVGLLAVRYEADVIVAAVRRGERPFTFEIVTEDVIRPADWRGEADPVTVVTLRALRAVERVIRRDPSQYLWLYARWGPEHAAAAQAGG